jgi:hypothetical protein
LATVRRAVLIALGTLAFAAVSLLLARWLTTESGERAAVHRLLSAQARGDTAGMLARLAPGCARRAGCRAAVVTDARRLRRPGAVKILAYDSRTAYTLGAAGGPTRVAWTVLGRGLPVVQCVQVLREGNLLSGRRIVLVSIGAPIPNQSSC